MTETKRRILVALAADADEIWTILRALAASGVARRHTGLATGECWRRRHPDLVPGVERRIALWLQQVDEQHAKPWCVLQRGIDADPAAMRLLTLSRRWMQPAQAAALDRALDAGGGAVFAFLVGVPCERAILQWLLRCIQQPLQLHDLDESHIRLDLKPSDG